MVDELDNLSKREEIKQAATDLRAALEGINVDLKVKVEQAKRDNRSPEFLRGFDAGGEYVLKRMELLLPKANAIIERVSREGERWMAEAERLPEKTGRSGGGSWLFLHSRWGL